MSKSGLAMLRSLVGRNDVYARQRPDGSWLPVREPLSNAVLLKHLRRAHTVGTYVVDGDKARTLVLDFDSGANAAVEASKALGALDTLGVPAAATGLEFSGSKGYHAWVVVRSPVRAADLRRLGRAALALAGVEAEVFPKQSTASDLGNLVKLPGGVHQVTGQDYDFITDLPVPCSPHQLTPVFAALPAEAAPKASGGAPGGFRCMDLAQAGPTEGWRNKGLFQLATLLRRAGVNDENTWTIVSAANDHAEPTPLPADQLAALLASSRVSGPICRDLPTEVQCDHCPFQQPPGLGLRTNQLRNGACGERAVVELGKRRPDGAVELLHPDLPKPMLVLIQP